MWSLEERAYTVREGLAPLVVGRKAFPIADLVAFLQSTLARIGPLWSRVAVQSAIAAFEVALWDALGRREGAPIYELLGGTREWIPLYAVGFAGDADEIAAQAALALADGYAAVKVRVGMDADADERLLRAIRASIGDNATMLVDANMAWTRGEASEMAARLRSYGLGWLEEPLDCDDVEGLAALRRETGLPIAAGENAYGVAAGVALLEAGAVDVLMPDIARCGGIDAARALISAARAHGIPYSLHHYASDVGFATMLHLCCAEPGFRPILRDTSAWPLRTELVRAPVEIEDGSAAPPQGRGLGIEVNEKTVATYRVV